MAQALKWLREKPDHDPPTAIVGKVWQRHVVQEDGRIDATAYSFCALDKLSSAIPPPRRLPLAGPDVATGGNAEDAGKKEQQHGLKLPSVGS